MFSGEDSYFDCFTAQVTHSRKPNAAWSLSSGNLLRRGSCLLVSLTQDVASGDSIQMDYGKESLDAKIALNYGVVDKQIPMVSCI